MLELFRKHLLGWFSKILIGLITIAFALFGIEYYLVGSHSDPSLATVNGQKITAGDLKAAYNRNRNKLLNQYGADLRLTPDLQEQLRQEALKELITRQVIYQGVSKAGFKTSPLSVQAVIEQMPAFQVEGKFSPDRFQRLLYNLSYTESSFYQDISHTLTVGQFNEGVTLSAFVLPNEIEKAYEMADQKRNFRYLVLPVAQFERDVKINDAEIKTYYDAHKKDYQSEAQVSVDYIDLSVDDVKAKQSLTQQEILDFYQNNQSAFASPARWQVAKVLVPVAIDAETKVINEAKSRVNSLTEQLKQSKLPADAKTEWVVANKDSLDLVKLFSSMKVGDVSGPQPKKEGFTIYKLLALEAPKPQPLSAVETQVKEALLKQKAEHEFTTRTDELSELAFTHPDSLTPIAQAMNVPIKSTEFFTRRGSKEGMEASPKFVSAAFGNEVLQQGSNSAPVDVGNGHVVVLRLKSQKPAATLPLDAVKDKIVAILKRQQAQVAVGKLGSSLVEALRVGKDSQTIMSANQLKWQEKLMVSRQDSGISRELLQLAFHQPVSKGKGASYGSATLSNGDYAIVSVEKVTLPNVKSMTASVRENLKKALSLNYGSLDFNLYVKDLSDKAEINMKSKGAPIISAPSDPDDF